MPLLAVVDGERTISSELSAEDWETLKADVRAKRRTVALGCGLPGHAKTSKLGTAYFAHNPGGDGCSAGETSEHLLAKAIIVRTALEAGWDAEPEVRGQLDGEEWIADVMATKDGVRVVFEVQWTRQSLTDYQARQRRYLNSGIAACAWFARHVDHLPKADKTLPVFALFVRDDGTARAGTGNIGLPLADAVTRLLTRRLQHRTHLASANATSTVHVRDRDMDCYRCHKTLTVWRVDSIEVTGRCGTTDDIRRALTEPFQPTRPEAHRLIREAATHAIRQRGGNPAGIANRYTQASGTTYQAFTCPHCGATCGDYFVHEAFAYPFDTSLTITVPGLAIERDHWCPSDDTAPCDPPPDTVLALTRALVGDNPDGQRPSAHATVSVEPVGQPGGISINTAMIACSAAASPNPGSGE